MFWTWLFWIHFNSWSFDPTNTLAVAYNFQGSTRCAKICRTVFFHVYVHVFLSILREFCEDRKKIFSPCRLQNKGFQVLNKLKYRGALSTIRGSLWKHIPDFILNMKLSLINNRPFSTYCKYVSERSVIFIILRFMANWVAYWYISNLQQHRSI